MKADRLMQVKTTFFLLAATACGTSEVLPGGDGGDGGVVPDSGVVSFEVKGRVVKAPYGLSLETDYSMISVGLYKKLDRTGMLPDSEPVSLVKASSDGSFKLDAPSDCTAMLVAFTGDPQLESGGKPAPGSIVGTYAQNPVCRNDLNSVISLDHYLPGANKPAVLSKWKKAAALESIEALIQSPYIDFTAYREGDRLFVNSARGSIEIHRDQSGDFVVDVTGGANPFSKDSLSFLSDYDEELAAGANPSGTHYSGYSTGDPRLSFVEVDGTSYPQYAERLWQVFEDERCGDVVTFPVPYGSGYTGNRGEHGSLDVTQSRTVLLLSGAGVKKGQRQDRAAGAVDIAPTVAKILGVTVTAGTSGKGAFEPGKYLKWQDGEQLDNIIDGNKAEYALIIVLDGLNFTELSRALKYGVPMLPAISELMENGAFFNYGQIANFPSITLPGHIAVGTGAYSGHHGVANNAFYERGEGTLYNIVTAGAAPGRFLRPWVETIFEAVQRTFGKWDERRKKGAFCASVNEPTTRGADYATLEGIIFNYSDEIFDEDLPTTPGYETYSGADNTAVKQCIYLYERKKLPIPKITMVNLAISDFVGHGTGPHSDLIRQVLADTDLRIGRILKALKNAGIYEKTVIVLTGDHGQEIQDKKRSLEFGIVNNSFYLPLLDVKGLKYIGAPPFLYVKSMEISLNPPEVRLGQTYNLKVSVKNEDSKKMLSEAEIQCFESDSSTVISSCTTDFSGSCELKSIKTDKNFSISARHKDFNPALLEIMPTP